MRLNESLMRMGICGMSLFFGLFSRGATLAAQDAQTVVWDWNGIIGTGQSLSVGTQPILSDEQAWGNLRLARTDANEFPLNPDNETLAMEPLIELQTAQGYPAPYPGNLYGETPHTAMANQISSLEKKRSGSPYVTVHSVVGESGQGMIVIRKVARNLGKTGKAYVSSLFEMKAIARLAKAAGKSYGVRAITLTHGETDSGSGTYERDMVKLLADYNKDIKAITGQTADAIMLVVQQHSCPSPTGVSASTLAEWKAGIDHPGKIVCIGPNYQRMYSSDFTHLTSAGYRHLGEKYGQVYWERVVAGHDWQPLQPEKVEAKGREVTVSFHVPVGPLAWDSVMVPPYQEVATEWKNGKGFELNAGSERLPIESVSIKGDSVVITCGKDLPDTGVTVGYAITGDGGTRVNGTRRWGLLRDSDPFVGLSGYAQPNYCVAFRTELPWQAAQAQAQ